MEPYWNVNKETGRRKSIRKSVLMEPYWNVNILCYQNRFPVLRINGTILECKPVSIIVLFSASYCINGTILECKHCFNVRFFSILAFRINGTILECKHDLVLVGLMLRQSINGTILECKRLFSSPNRAR